MKLQLVKILLIFTLYLISGPVGCVDVIGYSGGSVIIISNLKVYSEKSKYICKVEKGECTGIRNTTTAKNHIQEEKFKLYENTHRFLTVFIRKLKPQDAGTYTMGVGTWKTDVNLKVVNDSCCEGPKITNAFLGQNTTFICNYPGEYERHYKYIKKIDNDSVVEVILDTSKKTKNGRFSFSDDRRAKVLSVNISDVSEADDGFYLCGVYKDVFPIRYYSYFSEVQLQVTDNHHLHDAPTEISSHEVHSSPSHVVIISVCVCVALLLFGGFALMIYKQRQKTILGSTPSSQGNEP
ncbi:polymeric immunoglobulin receptor-like, partial [Clarias magur]